MPRLKYQPMQVNHLGCKVCKFEDANASIATKLSIFVINFNYVVFYFRLVI